MQPSQPSFHKTNLISSLLIMSSFYSSLRFLSNEGCKSYRPLHPQSLTPLPFFLLRTSKSTKRAGEAVTLSTMCPHAHVSTPGQSRGITTYTLYYLSIHGIYSVLSEYTRRIPSGYTHASTPPHTRSPHTHVYSSSDIPYHTQPITQTFL